MIWFDLICMNIFGLVWESFRTRRWYLWLSTGLPAASRQWTWWDTWCLSRTSLWGFLQPTRSEVACWGENRTPFLVILALWRDMGEDGARVNGAGVHGARVNRVRVNKARVKGAGVDWRSAMSGRLLWHNRLIREDSFKAINKNSQNWSLS